MPKTTRETAVIFCRVSTAAQADKWSLPVQLEHNKEYARKKGFKVIHEPWSITESGYKERNRRAFKVMVEYVKQNHIQHLIVLNVERLSRDLHGMLALDGLSRDFLTIHFTESGETIDKNSNGDKRTLWVIKVAFARAFIDELKEKARRSFEGRLNVGLYPANPPLGFSCKKNMLSPNEAEMPMVSKMFKYYSSGLYSEFALAEKMYEEGLRTRKGRKVSVATISEALNNRLYIGFVKWPFTESKYVAAPHYKGEWIKGQHDGIVDRATWDRVQEVLKERSHPWSRRNSFQAYRGQLRCGACGRLMTPYTAKGHVYYYSGNPRGERCSHSRGYTELAIEESIKGTLARFSFPKELYDWLRETLMVTSKDNQSAIRAERKRLQTDLNRCRADLEAIFNLTLEKIFGLEVARAKVEEIRARQGQLESAMQSLENAADSSINDGLMLLELVQDLPRAFEAASPQQHSKMVRILFKKITVLDGKFDFVPHDVFVPLYNAGFYKQGEWRA